MGKVWAYLLSIAPKVLMAGAIVGIGILLIFLLVKVAKRAMEHKNTDVSLQNFLLQTLKIAGYVVIAISALSTLGVSTTGLIAGFSAAAAAIALALKDSLSNVAAGILILFTHPFETNDFITADGEAGTVKKIDVMHTTLVTGDNRQIIIPNGVLSSNKVINYSKEPLRRVDLTFSVSYDDDVEKVKETVRATAAQHPLVLSEPAEPFVRVSEYADSSVNVVARVWCRAEDYWTVHFDLMEQVRVAFNRENVTIPYRQLDVRLVGKDEKK